MLIHISDCQSFDQNIEITPPCTVHSLLEQIMAKYKYDTTLCSVFQNGKELEFGVKITPELIKNDNTLILFNQLFFKEKTYSNVDQTFNFRQTRFQNHYIDLNINKINANINSLNSFNNSNIQQSYYNYLQSQIYPEFTISQEHEEQNESENNKNDDNSNDDNDNNESDDIESLVDLDPSEQEAVDRLCSLGFDRLFVIQIFMACDRNEEAALNLLQSM